MACANFILLIITILCFLTSNFAYEQNDTLKQGQILRDYEQLISAGRVFRLGFFTPNPNAGLIGTAGGRYLEIWFEQIPVYSVWVANRENPVPDSSGALTIDSDGKLNITYQGGPPIVINSNIQAPKYSSGNITATLLDSGNFVVRQLDSDGIAGPVLWQSFDYPHNMLLPGMKLGMNLKTGQNWSLVSWLSEKIPAPGAFRLGLDPSGADQLLVWRRDEIYWSSGVWQNGSFQSAPELTKRNDIYDFRFVSNKEERYFSYSIKARSILSRWDLDTLGEITVFTLDDRDGNGSPHWIFETSGPCYYDAKNSTSVCLSEKPTKCRNGTEYFVRKRGYVDRAESVYYDPDASLALSDCHAKCWRNCTCGAFRAFANSGGGGCEFWNNVSNFFPSDDLDFVYLLTNENNEGSRF